MFKFKKFISYEPQIIFLLVDLFVLKADKLK